MMCLRGWCGSMLLLMLPLVVRSSELSPNEKAQRDAAGQHVQRANLKWGWTNWHIRCE